MTVYTAAPAVEAVARVAISRWHRHLEGERIEYVFRDKPAKTKGRPKLGTARKVSGLNAYLAMAIESEMVEDFFVIEIAEPAWVAMDDQQRLALVDHELAHCSLDDDGNLVIVGHDLEEFNAVVERHGLWKQDVEAFLKAAVASGQLTFDDEEDQ